MSNNSTQADYTAYEPGYTEITTGLRRGEICGLRWGDFDEQNGVLHVRRTLHMEDGRPVTGATKTGSGTRDILLADSTTELLQRRKAASCSEWIFPNPLRPEQPLSPSAAYARLKTLLRDANLPDIRFRDLRHTFSTHALKSGVDAKTLSAVVGHVSAAITLDVYTHVTTEMQKNAAARIDRGIAKNKRQKPAPEASEHRMTDFEARKGKRRPGTGCVTLPGGIYGRGAIRRPTPTASAIPATSTPTARRSARRSSRGSSRK